MPVILQLWKERPVRQQRKNAELISVSEATHQNDCSVIHRAIIKADDVQALKEAVLDLRLTFEARAQAGNLREIVRSDRARPEFNVTKVGQLKLLERSEEIECSDLCSEYIASLRIMTSTSGLTAAMVWASGVKTSMWPLPTVQS